MEYPQEVPFSGPFYIKSKTLPPASLLTSLSAQQLLAGIIWPLTLGGICLIQNPAGWVWAWLGEIPLSPGFA